MKVKVLECKFLVDEKIRHFCFEGVVCIDGEHLDVDDISIKEITEAGEVPFQITAKHWIGEQITEWEALCDVISRYTRNEKGVQLLYMDERIKTYLHVKKEGSVYTPEREIPYRIRHGYFLYEYELLLVTNAYTFYGDGESALMLQTDTGEVISDNYFAEDGLLQSLEAIEKGEEQQLYKDPQLLESEELEYEMRRIAQEMVLYPRDEYPREYENASNQWNELVSRDEQLAAGILKEYGLR